MALSAGKVRPAIAELDAMDADEFVAALGTVVEHSVGSLRAWGEARLGRDAEAELATALAEVGKIVGLRLRELVAE